MRSRLAVAVALAGILTACGSSGGSPGVSADGDGHVQAPPPGPEQEPALVRTAEGIARIRVFIEHPGTIGQDERVSFRLDNAGEVPVTVGGGFAVERWDGDAWKEVDRGEHSVDPRHLAAGGRTDPTVWPVASAEGHDLEPGWYRISMSARVDRSDGGTGRELVARGRFEVRSPDWDAPPEDQYEGVVRSETRRGVAAVELVVEPREVTPDGEVSIRLVNRGDVTLTTGYGYTVEWWDEGAWVRPVEPDGGGGPAVAISLRPGEDTASRMRWPETWPHRSLDPGPMEPGWYRVVKSASTEGSGSEDPSVDLAARALFHVEP